MIAISGTFALRVRLARKKSHCLLNRLSKPHGPSVKTERQHGFPRHTGHASFAAIAAFAIVRDDDVCRRLMTIPGVGPVVALSYRVSPTRIICAMPRASLRSVLLICAFNIALMCRVSTQITGKPASARTL
jgi:hypothetical protein